MRASPSTCKVITIDWQVLVLCCCLCHTHVVCACVRVWSLPGGFLPSQHRRRHIVFRVLFQQTNKHTNNPVNYFAGGVDIDGGARGIREGAYCRALPRGRWLKRIRSCGTNSVSVHFWAKVGDDLQSWLIIKHTSVPASKHPRGLMANNLAEARFLTELLPHNLSLFTP